MYATCGSLRDVRIVVDGFREKNVVAWSAMIAEYAQQEGMGQDALSLYSAMWTGGMVVPNSVTFVCLLQARANIGVFALEKGKQLHSEIEELGVESDVAGDGGLVNMIAGYAQQEGMGQDALSLYSAMWNGGMVIPNSVTSVCLLQACANIGVSALEQGRQLLSEIEELGVESDVAGDGGLVNMYAKCGSLSDARIVFDRLREKNVETWNAMIAGYAHQEGMGQDALGLYSAVRNEGTMP